MTDASNNVPDMPDMPDNTPNRANEILDRLVGHYESVGLPELVRPWHWARAYGGRVAENLAAAHHPEGVP